MATSCRRRVLSCYRCHKRKIKCDRLLPTCTNCVKAKVSCTGINKQHDTEAPRSVVEYLELEIARLENERQIQLSSGREWPNTSDTDIAGQDISTTALVLDHNNSLPIEEPRVPDTLKKSIISGQEMRAMLSSTLSKEPYVMELVSKVRMGLTPSMAMSPPSLMDHDSMSRSNIDPAHGDHLECTVLSSMPSHIIEGLVGKYVQHVLPAHPFLYEPEVREQGLKVTRDVSERRENPVVADYDYLIIYLILAIAVTLGSSRSTYQDRHMKLSESLFVEGMQHYSTTGIFPSEIAAIQSTLLILMYAQVNPRCGNVWILSGAVMRSCLELGLHREPTAGENLDPLTSDMRRRVFWSAYCVDRTVCSALQRPLTIPDITINSKHPLILDDSCIDSMGVGMEGLPTKAPALREIEYRQWQSRVTEVHFQGKPLDQGQDWNNWLYISETQLRDWCQRGTKEATEFPLAQGLVNLHRPSPRMPRPSGESLVVAFEAAWTSARIYKDQIMTGYFRRPWLAAHYMQEAAIVALFALRHELDRICERFGVQEIFDIMKTYTSNFLAISMQGWPEISTYAATYERLLGPIVTYLFTHAGVLSDYFGPIQDSELNDLLYPGPAEVEMLRSGNRPSMTGYYRADSVDGLTWCDEFVGMLTDNTDGIWSGFELDAFIRNGSELDF